MSYQYEPFESQEDEESDNEADLEKLKELCIMMVEEARKRDDLLSCPHTDFLESER